MERLLTAEQVAEIIRVNIAVLYQWTHRGAIPHIKISKRMIRFREEEVMEWLDSKACQPGTEKPQQKRGKNTGRPRKAQKNDEIDRMVQAAREEVLGQ
jgi:excisionase family DNA binding protein